MSLHVLVPISLTMFPLDFLPESRCDRTLHSPLSCPSATNSQQDIRVSIRSFSYAGRQDISRSKVNQVSHVEER